jgi:hypothetical protein
VVYFSALVLVWRVCGSLRTLWQDSRCSTPDSNRILPEYKLEILTLESLWSVLYCPLCQSTILAFFLMYMKINYECKNASGMSLHCKHFHTEIKTSCFCNTAVMSCSFTASRVVVHWVIRPLRVLLVDALPLGYWWITILCRKSDTLCKKETECWILAGIITCEPRLRKGDQRLGSNTTHLQIELCKNKIKVTSVWLLWELREY